MRANDENLMDTRGYNNFLPNQKNELDVQEPNAIYKKSQQDSLDALNQKGLFKNIVNSKKENDSLERVLEELNNFSLGATSAPIKKVSNSSTPSNSYYENKKTEAQEKLEYRKLLMEARDERLSRSQDYSAPYSEKSNEVNTASINFDASIYRDQFILPGDRVTLILKEDVYFNGTHFPKNTFVYAISNVQGARVLLEITNIKTVRLSLTAIDQEDGMQGIHNERASELLQEFKADIEEEGFNNLSNGVSNVTDMPLAKNLVRSFGNFFSKKKYKQRDKILLVNGDRVFLVSKK